MKILNKSAYMVRIISRDIREMGNKGQRSQFGKIDNIPHAKEDKEKMQRFGWLW